MSRTLPHYYHLFISNYYPSTTTLSSLPPPPPYAGSKSPAKRSGDVEIGDSLIAVDGVDVINLSFVETLDVLGKCLVRLIEPSHAVSTTFMISTTFHGILLIYSLYSSLWRYCFYKN